MASKTKRSKREAALHAESIPDESSSSLNGNSSRPSSPTSMYISSRQDEKRQLSHLNDRLATYIDTVRNLENENQQLQLRIHEMEFVDKKDKENLENRYKSKIDDLRNHNDAMVKQKARIQIDFDKAAAERDELRARVGKLEKDFKKSDAERKKLMTQLEDMTAQHNKADKARAIAEKENDDLQREVVSLDRQVKMLQQQLEDEVVLRTEAENRFHSVKDDLDFARQTHQSQLEEVRRKRQLELTTLHVEVKNRYDSQLQEQLQKMRADFDNKIAQNRADLENMYQNKLNDANDNLARSGEAIVQARKESDLVRTRIRELERVASENDQLIDRLNRRINDLDAQHLMTLDDCNSRIKQRDDHITQLQKEISTMIKDYQDLLDIKLQLDTELQAYHKLLEGEETRLKITPLNSPDTSMNQSSTGKNVSFADSAGGILASPGSSRRGIKRPRLNDDYDRFERLPSYKTNEYAEGNISISDADVQGKYVRVKNKGSDDVSIAGWGIKYTAGEREVTYKFNSRQIIKAGKDITIWSNNAGQEHNPPQNLVMKNQIWPTGDASRIELMSGPDEVVAWRESMLEGLGPDERCSIM